MPIPGPGSCREGREQPSGKACPSLSSEASERPVRLPALSREASGLDLCFFLFASWPVRECQDRVLLGSKRRQTH